MKDTKPIRSKLSLSWKRHEHFTYAEAKGDAVGSCVKLAQEISQTADKWGGGHKTSYFADVMRESALVGIF